MSDKELLEVINYSLWGVELGRDEYSDSAYQFQRADQQVRQLQTERKHLIEKIEREKERG